MVDLVPPPIDPAHLTRALLDVIGYDAGAISKALDIFAGRSYAAGDAIPLAALEDVVSLRNAISRSVEGAYDAQKTEHHRFEHGAFVIEVRLDIADGKVDDVVVYKEVGALSELASTLRQ